MTTMAETLSGYASSLRYEDLPEETVHLAKRFTIDTLGCALGGYGSGRRGWLARWQEWSPAAIRLR